MAKKTQQELDKEAVQLKIRLTRKQRRELKVLAAQLGTSMNQLVDEAINDFILGQTPIK